MIVSFTILLRIFAFSGTVSTQNSLPFIHQETFTIPYTAYLLSMDKHEQCKMPNWKEIYICKTRLTLTISFEKYAYLVDGGDLIIPRLYLTQRVSFPSSCQDKVDQLQPASTCDVIFLTPKLFGICECFISETYYITCVDSDG